MRPIPQQPRIGSPQNWVSRKFKPFGRPRTSCMAESITGAQEEDCRQGPPGGQERQMCQKPEMTCLDVVSGTEAGRNCTLTAHKLSAHQDPPSGELQVRFQGTF